MIHGIWSDEADRFHPDQWVNVWLVHACQTSEFYCSAQVKDLPELMADHDEYGLEPTDEDGTVMTVSEAVRRKNSG